MLSFNETNRKRYLFQGLILVVLLGSIIYANVLHAPFLFDDRGTITENEKVKQLQQAFFDISNSRYVGILSFSLNYSFGGLHVFGYHLVNNLIHAANALLIFYLIVTMLQTPMMEEGIRSREIAALIAAFLFIAHPALTQAVSYISQRFTSLAAMFYLSSLIAYLKARMMVAAGDIPSPRKFSESAVPALACLLFSVMALKTKEIAVTLPFAMIMCEVYCFGFSRKQRKYVFMIVVLALPIAALTVLPSGIFSPGKSLTDAVSTVDTISRETANISRRDYLLTQFGVVVTYLRLLFFPVNQTFDYDYPVQTEFFSAPVLLPLVVLMLVFSTAIWTFKKARLVSFGILWFFLALSVESSIIPIRDVINEHRLYLPSAGIFMASAAVLDRLIPANVVRGALSALLVLVLSVATVHRNSIWSDPETVWADVIAKAPNNARAYNNLGVVYKERREYAKALEQFEKSLKTDRNFAAVYYNIGDVQYRLGNYEGALEFLDKAQSGNVDRYLRLDIINKIGRTYGALGQYDKAIQILGDGLRLYPSSLVLMNNLGVQYIKAGQIDRAIKLYEEALAIREQISLYANLAIAYDMKGELEKAARMRQRATDLQGTQ